ncbi:7-carboxy-7-deazaguanine synthase QueE [Foetidibacter luteolus]|uniref:7-carboxy-7-deazaguanine synthase QueE n=1 Tax=Foetidibacter luteolus TaxID=2608880 RepID=UPI001F3B80B2|nr:7-carboxy-7-deazaguanine synthase QueE [Foetidibacter luteolus]
MLTATQPTAALPVMESFYTLQGEGFHQGRAAYFIRLGGCDVGCFWCDVKESWDASIHPVKSIQEMVEQALQEIGGARPSETKNLVVITGGEPLMHNLDALTLALHQAGFETNIETSGSSPLSGYWDWICLSPKKFKAPLPQVVAAANELKVVIYNKSDFTWAEKYAAQVSANCKLYLQPEWDKSAEMMPLIIDYIKLNPKWELSLQIHKFINVP